MPKNVDRHIVITHNNINSIHNVTFSYIGGYILYLYDNRNGWQTREGFYPPPNCRPIALHCSFSHQKQIECIHCKLGIQKTHKLYFLNLTGLQNTLHIYLFLPLTMMHLVPLVQHQPRPVVFLHSLRFNGKPLYLYPNIQEPKTHKTISDFLLKQLMVISWGIASLFHSLQCTLSMLLCEEHPNHYPLFIEYFLPPTPSQGPCILSAQCNQ